jgi:hypothetical protein
MNPTTNPTYLLADVEVVACVIFPRSCPAEVQ